MSGPKGWWDGDDQPILGATPTAANSALPMAIGFTATLISFLVLQILLIAVALGSADYARGLPGAISGRGLTVSSALVVGFSCALGAGTAAVLLRRADVERRGVLRLAPLAPGLIAVGIALNGLVAGSGLRGVLVVAVAAVGGIVVGSRLGSRHNPGR